MKKENNFYKWINNWGLLIISAVIVIIYTSLNSGISTENEIDKSVLTNILFSIINLLAAFYISRKVSMWGWLTDNSNNQKKIAKTAIRHNRASLNSVYKLTRITQEKAEKVNDELVKQYLKEIQNHLEMIFNGLKNSEADFNEIVNDEIKEQNALEIEIFDLLDEIKKQKKTINELSDSDEKKNEKIAGLEEKLRKAERELSTKISSLPFGAPLSSESPPFNIGGNNYLVNENLKSFKFEDYQNKDSSIFGNLDK